jgi:ethanolamine utilization protein EutA (predicted chaperonin)
LFYNGKVAFASIDWHDFVIVETIEFTVADAESDLPLPMTRKTLENLNSIKKKADKVFEEIELGEDIMVCLECTKVRMLMRKFLQRFLLQKVLHRKLRLSLYQKLIQEKNLSRLTKKLELITFLKV